MQFEKMNKIYVASTVSRLDQHPEYEMINKIFSKSSYIYFAHLSDLFEREPLKYAEIEDILCEKNKLEGPSLLEILKREGKRIFYSELLTCGEMHENYRICVIDELFKECQKESRMEIITNYSKNGYYIEETTFPDFHRLIEEKNKRRLKNDLKKRNFERCFRIYIVKGQ